MTSRNRGGHPFQHNHVTRDIKPPGECPACDEYHQGRSVAEPRNGGGTHFTGVAVVTEPSREDRIRAAQKKLEAAAADTTPRNAGFSLTRGHLYRIRSRNLPYGVYDGHGGFIGIREKFDYLYLFTEYDYDQGAPYGTVVAQEDLGPVPDSVTPVELLPGPDNRSVRNDALFKFLSDAEQALGRGVGYGGRPGDDPAEAE